MVRLEAIKESMMSRGKLAVLLSGGLDSTFLAWLAHEALGTEAKALTFHSPHHPRERCCRRKDARRAYRHRLRGDLYQ